MQSRLSLPHATDLDMVAKGLDVDPARGLSSDQAGQRLEHYGPNTLQTVRSRPAWRILIDQFASLIIALLAAASLIAWLTRDVAEAIAILGVLVLNALIGFAVEWEAGHALDALRRSIKMTARVRRQGRETTLPAEELVPGDILILNAGDRVPADARLLEASSLRTAEAALTGESAPVQKAANSVGLDALLAERSSMLYLGTTIDAGRALAIVTATGASTELGKIGRLVAEAPDESTPLERRLGALGRRLVILVLAIAAVVILTGWLRGDNLWTMAEVGISLAVAAVPEGLPAVTTLILALGVLRMARQRAIVRRLPAVETLGSTTVICADKTGTLTENRMTVREYRLADGRIIELADEKLTMREDELLVRAARVSVLCNEASLQSEGGSSHAIGDPTETALLVVADAYVLDVEQERARHPQLDERPFQADTKRMTTLHHAHDGVHLVALKGAPAAVLPACSHYADGADADRPLSDEMRGEFHAVNEEMAGRALRVLALAEKRLSRGVESLSEAEIEEGFTFLAFVGMADPPRPGVARAIALARAAGIRTVMLTGDQINTARAIARELSLCGDKEPRALHASELEGADLQDLAKLADATDVFARVTPEDKLRIVEALQQAGQIVAVTGDGVNDAPALKRADIGIAMGERGTEVAKEASDMILADDNFATIIKAVEGGRTIYANIVKFVHMMFSDNLGEVIFIFLAIAVGLPLPLLPLQILWVNLVTDIFPALALAVEPATKDVMQRPPRSPQSTLLSRRFLMLISWQGAMLAAITMGAYLWSLSQYGPGVHARTVALLALVGVELGHTFNCRSQTRSAFEGLFTNPFVWMAAGSMIGLQLLAVYFTPLALVLDVVPPNGADWAVIAITAVVPIVIVEVTKAFARRGRRTEPLAVASG
jgi:Ca2+-transporting ATPase